jgi:hypothetical protein
MSQPQQELAVSSADVGDPCISDLNSDGRKDIAVLRTPAPGAKGSVSIFYQNSDGSVGQESMYNESFVRLTGKIRSADMDSDGRNDLVFQSGDSSFSIVPQSADGTLSMTPDIYTVTGDSPFFDSFTVGDVNGDGKNDAVVVTKGTPGSLCLFVQNTAGKLDVPAQIDLMQNPPYEIELADIDGDGLNDILGEVVNTVVSSDTGAHVRVYYQNADHTFSALHYDSFLFSAVFSSNTTLRVSPSLASGDVTGDDLHDVIVGWDVEGLFVLPGTAEQASPGTTFSISGKITSEGGPLSGVSVTLSGVASKRTTTDANGNYTFSILGNGSYTVTPSKTSYSFTPVSRSVTINDANIAGQDFIGATFSISGTITSDGGPLAGVSVTLGGAANKRTTTDANGYYSFNVLGSGTYTIMPSKTGYSFVPSIRTVTVSDANITGQDFIGMTFSISGTITANGSPLSGVTLVLSGVASKRTTTDANGNYTFSILSNGNYTVTPSRIGYSFTPPSRSVTINDANVGGQDFTAN